MTVSLGVSEFIDIDYGFPFNYLGITSAERAKKAPAEVLKCISCYSVLHQCSYLSLYDST